MPRVVPRQSARLRVTLKVCLNLLSMNRQIINQSVLEQMDVISGE